MGLKLHRVTDYGTGANSPYLMFHCPGCNNDHCISKKVHHWNGSLARPTFQPSVLHDGSKGRCHSWVTDGKINFCPDSTHALRGKTVDLPDWEKEVKPIMADKNFKKGDPVTINAGHLAGVAAELVFQTAGANVVRITDTNSFENMLAMLTDDQLDPRPEEQAKGTKPEIEL